MHRYRESALIMEAMVDELPAGRIVESASANLVQCWSALEVLAKGRSRPPKPSQRNFPNPTRFPSFAICRASQSKETAAIAKLFAIFETICKDHASSDYAPRAGFMGAFSLLQASENKAAITKFERFEEQYPRHDLRQDAMYWRGVGWSL